MLATYIKCHASRQFSTIQELGSLSEDYHYGAMGLFVDIFGGSDVYGVRTGIYVRGEDYVDSIYPDKGSQTVYIFGLASIGHSDV
jgi:hypothetical protein